MELSGQHEALVALPLRRNAGTRWIARSVGPIAGLGALEKSILHLVGFKIQTVRPTA